MTAAGLALLAAAAGAAGQAPARGGEPGPLTVALVTFGPGPQTWERFGHNALLIRDPATGETVAYDFGRFDFNEPGFLLHFAQGRMLYWMGRADGDLLVEYYRRLGRSIAIQELDLPPAARQALRDSLEATYARDQGRYRYDYYLDNCSTRLRDAIDVALGGRVRARLDTAWTGTTFREHSRRSLENNLVVYTAVESLLGRFADRAITKWEESFLPELLRAHLREVTLRDPDGGVRPLVSREEVLEGAERWPVPAEPTRRPAVLLTLLGLVWGGGILLLARGARAGRRRMRTAFYAAVGLWEALAGVLALLAVWLWGFSDHAAAYNNVHVLQFSLASVALLGLLPLAARGAPRATAAVRVLAAAAAAASLLGLVLGEWAGMQEGGEVAGLALPAHLAVWLGFLLVAPRTPSSSAAPPPPR